MGSENSFLCLKMLSGCVTNCLTSAKVELLVWKALSTRLNGFKSCFLPSVQWIYHRSLEVNFRWFQLRSQHISLNQGLPKKGLFSSGSISSTLSSLNKHHLMTYRKACSNWSRVWFYFRFLFNDLFNRIVLALRGLLRKWRQESNKTSLPSIACLHKSVKRLSEGMIYENDDQKPDIIVHLNQIIVNRGRQIVWSHNNWIRFSNTNVSERLPSKMKSFFMHKSLVRPSH